MTEQQFLADTKTFDATQHCLLRISEAAKKLGALAATQHCLLRISEAAKKLGALAKELAPDQPWADIRGIGNRLRHEYDKIDRDEIWRTVTDDLAVNLVVF